MRDLVETVIAQVLQQDKKAARPVVDPEAFKKQMAKALNDKAVALQDKKIVQTTDRPEVMKSKFVKSLNHGVKVQVDKNESHTIKNKELWDVSVKFEAIFFQQMMSAMRKTVPESGFLPHGFAEGVQESMFDQAIADAGSKSGSLGIAMNIYRQLERSDQVKPADAEKAIQEMRQASDRQDVSMYAELRGDVDGTH